MKKIGILTINDYSNYGNRLQNYAVQEVLKELDTDPTTVVNLTKTAKTFEQKTETSASEQKFSADQAYKTFKRKLYNGTHKKKIAELKEEKVKRFKAFTDTYISETDYSIKDGEVPADLNDQFDLFVTGSDQVWNPTFKHFSEIDFLTFASNDKRIAFSPSIGISEIPEPFVEDFTKWLNGMASLSVREEAGAEIISELTGREAEVLLDPTMLLDRQHWLDLARPFKNKPSKPYLCTYFLGDTYLEQKKEIEQMAKKYNLELINLGNQYDLRQYEADPAEFLDFIASSELFLTDSFHGTIFSILFEKPFVVFNRTGRLMSMNSRIDTILKKFKFEERKWEDMKNNANYLAIEFDHVDAILQKERQKAEDYLKQAIK